MDLRDQLQSTLGDGYRIERELAGAGMSRVFVAHEKTLGRPVVLKTLATEYGGAISVERFRREIRLAASLQQANIVPVQFAGDMDGIPFYAMPFIEGETLRERLARGALPTREAINILRDIARALCFAHERGVVHRDIKPENVLLSGSTAMVTDFGIAKALEASSTEPGSATLTQLGVTLGTPAYMSPEQAVGDPDVDHRSDLYAFGVVGYELLTGAAPFRGPTPLAMVAAHIGEQPADIARRRGIPPALGHLVMRCLAKDPERRPQTAREVLDTLEDVSTHAVTSEDQTNASPPTVAVLPLRNMSSSADDEYFSDGITEDIITQLSQIAGLRVISRTSAMAFKKSEKPMREIARALNATHVVEGSVRRAGPRLRIVAQLIDADTDAHVWAETFDRDLTDVFAVQTEVSERIAAGLRTRLAPNERRRIAKAPTTDPEAYNLYLLARHHANLATADGIARAADFYQRAVERDPMFARAWAAQAFAYFFHLAGYYGVRPRDAAPKIVQLATRALEIDPDIAEAHMMLGYVAELIDFDSATDRARKERALDLSPNLADAHLGYGNCLVIAGRYDEAIEEARIALELDPASEYVHVHANWLRYQTRRFDLALPAVEAAEAQFGPRVLPLVRAETLMGLGRVDEAAAALRVLHDHTPSTFNLAVLAWGTAAAGREAEARVILTELHRREAHEYVWVMPIAAAYAHLGDMDTAFAHLRRCFDDRAAWIQMPYSPTFDPFRGDPRFEDIVRRAGAHPPKRA